MPALFRHCPCRPRQRCSCQHRHHNRRVLRGHRRHLHLKSMNSRRYHLRRSKNHRNHRNQAEWPPNARTNRHHKHRCRRCQRGDNEAGARPNSSQRLYQFRRRHRRQASVQQQRRDQHHRPQLQRLQPRISTPGMLATACMTRAGTNSVPRMAPYASTTTAPTAPVAATRPAHRHLCAIHHSRHLSVPCLRLTFL